MLAGTEVLEEYKWQRFQGKTKRILIAYFILSILILMLAFRLAWIQIVRADEYTEKAIAQQTSDIPIEAKRGAITDRNGKELATSATCYSLWVWPITDKRDVQNRRKA